MAGERSLADGHRWVLAGLNFRFYLQVADDVQRRITEGEIATKLPSERSFAEEYGVAYTTVRHAMAVLRERGVIVTVHGRGTYVKPQNSED